MPTAYTEYRAIMLEKRLKDLTDPALKAAYGDLTGMRIAAVEEGIVVVTADYSDGETVEYFFGPERGAYDMADEVKRLVDRRCAEIRKARNNNQPNN